jgi:hypothetical protein
MHPHIQEITRHTELSEHGGYSHENPLAALLACGHVTLRMTQKYSTTSCVPEWGR